MSDFFLKTGTGFADLFEETLNSFTDTFDGTFTLEKNALQTSVDSLNDRIEDLNAILEVRKERLLRQFINMESILGQLQAQQQSLSAISLLKINKIGTGVA